MRQVGDRLHYSLESRSRNFVEHQSKYNGRGETENQLIHADDHRVSDHIPKVIRIEKTDEMFQSYPIACKNAPSAAKWGNIFEGNQNPEHGQVMKNKKINKTGKNQNIIKFVHPYTRP